MELPVLFAQRMKQQLGEEFDSFCRGLEQPRAQGLRANLLKVTPERLKELLPLGLEPVPWTEEGFYYQEGDRPGKHPLHEAGLYYIQEPSAMSAAAVLDPKPGERILDLCAAPGGKSTQIGCRMAGKGLLVSNEIHPGRAKILSQNIERMGIRNCVVTNEAPSTLSARFQEFFDRILVDAPCSGEGMFRKEPEALAQWTPKLVEQCAVRQDEILSQAALMLRPGGRMVYSTCTFAPAENEGTIHRFLDAHPNFVLDAIGGFSPGRPDWVEHGRPELVLTRRLWPHNLKGEGHFIALLRREGELTPAVPTQAAKVDRARLQDYFSFCSETLTRPIEGDFAFFGDQLYLLPEGIGSLQGLKVLRAGWHLGECKKNRFVPSHALALGLSNEEVVAFEPLPLDSQQLIAYLKGDSVQAPGPKGWTLMTAGEYPIGWGKRTEDMVKNHYPKGLRWMG